MVEIIAEVFQMTTGCCKRKSRLSYAVKDYYNVNPDLAVSPANRLVEFEALIARTHKAGLKLIIISYMKETIQRVRGLWEMMMWLPIKEITSIPNSYFEVPEAPMNAENHPLRRKFSKCPLNGLEMVLRRSNR
jgi:hypothetical protein